MENKAYLVVLSDNRNANTGLRKEHGLSVFLDTGTVKLLLDTGSSDAFAQNALFLGIDLMHINAVFLSHGHNDHTGGLTCFLSLNKQANIWISQEVNNQRYYSYKVDYKEIGCFNQEKAHLDRIHFETGLVQHAPPIVTFDPIDFDYPRPKANRRLFSKTEKVESARMVSDSLSHERILCIDAEQLFVYTGCAHAGLQNILKTVEQQLNRKPDVVLGGFHFPDAEASFPLETAEELQRLGAFLVSEYPQTRFITGHCTGDKAFDQLKRIMGSQVELFHTGYTTTI
jgi:7,8-dihydropterin-6-yl-methyl-4-(beta-D-ribofuranosyl)aminobenzene 5'-phosphate synthase